MSGRKIAIEHFNIFPTPRTPTLPPLRSHLSLPPAIESANLQKEI